MSDMQFSLLMPEILIYPHIEEEFNLCEREDWAEKIVDRVQYVLSPGRPMLLLRHFKTLHWGGYVPIQPDDWDRIQSRVRTIFGRISFAGYGNQFITWMARNTEGKLKTPTNILNKDSDDPDFWVGFTMHTVNAEIASKEDSFAQLTFLENTIFRFRNGDLK